MIKSKQTLKGKRSLVDLMKSYTSKRKATSNKVRVNWNLYEEVSHKLPVKVK